MSAIKVRVELPVYERDGSQNPDGLAPIIFESQGPHFILVRVGEHSYMVAPEDIERAVRAVQ